ncbi:MAG: PSP1 domain-containing protein [Bacteroidales bacterium]|jgi:cell fate regulator YaaT (PSP1 superfamily)
MEKTNFISENQEIEEDIHIACDHNYEGDKIAANPFLTRGLSEIPNPNEDNNHLYSYGCCQLANYDWLEDIRLPAFSEKQIVEVRFKNGDKDFFNLPVSNEFYEVGDIVLVEATNGTDIGIVSMMGHQVKLQMQNKNVSEVTKRVYHKARTNDIEKWVNLVKKENDTMMKSRYAAWDLQLDMKVNNVEYQGDGSKAIFYYSADKRVDFRELIKILAEKFRIRIEMRQIGVRQEAARLGGIGSCGRELCCSSWLNHFKSVNTAAAKTQQLSLNPQKLAGQCGKLKCCLNYENEACIEELKNFPNTNTVLYTEKGEAVCHKIDIFQNLMWYYYKNDDSHTLYAIPTDKIKEIIQSNKENKKVEDLERYAKINQSKFNEVEVNIDDLKRIND